VVLSANGRVKPDVVLVDGKQERHPEGAYYLEWRDAGKRVRLSVGKDAQDAAARRLRKEAELNAANHGVTVVAENGKAQSLQASIGEYLEEIKLTKKPKTLSAYSTSLSYFSESCHKLNLSDIDRRDMLKFAAFLRDEKEQSPRSCWNKFANVMSFLKVQGIRGLVGKNDWPRFTETEPEIYDREELDKLFAECDEEERLWFEFFLMTGFREQEVMYVTWNDINLSQCTASVRHKPEFGWTPKAYKEREVPIPAKLCTALRHKARTKANDCPLVFPTSGCKPKLNFLDDLKAVAQRAKLKPESHFTTAFLPERQDAEQNAAASHCAHTADLSVSDPAHVCTEPVRRSDADCSNFPYGKSIQCDRVCSHYRHSHIDRPMQSGRHNRLSGDCICERRSRHSFGHHHLSQRVQCH
jgi:integrase/recombinase XerD